MKALHYVQLTVCLLLHSWWQTIQKLAGGLGQAMQSNTWTGLLSSLLTRTAAWVT